MMLLETMRTDSKSEKEVRKNSIASNPADERKQPEIRPSRFTVEYWREKIFRPSYSHQDESHPVQEWYAQIQHGGRREKVGLGSNNKEDASRRAARFYSALRSKGWDETLKAFFPDRYAAPKNLLTVGDLIELVRPLAAVRPRTFEIYAYAFRKIAREATSTKDTDHRRFDPKSLVWRRESDGIHLAKLTPEAVAKWKATVVAEAGKDPVQQTRARRNVNSFIRSARALLSRKILKKLVEKAVVLPKPLPFEGVEMERQGNTRYHSTIDATKLLREGKKQLSEKDPEAWKVILLALGAGLRRGEIDRLNWEQLDFGRSEIRIFNHSQFEAKTESSEDVVFVDPGLMAELRKSRDSAKSSFVMESSTPVRESGAAQFYRCQETFERATAWLRAQGVQDDKPLHVLRKEFGSMICASADIHTASRQLRHANLATTAAFYTDHRRRATVPVADILKPPIPLKGRRKAKSKRKKVSGKS